MVCCLTTPDLDDFEVTQRSYHGLDDGPRFVRLRCHQRMLRLRSLAFLRHRFVGHLHQSGAKWDIW